MWILHCIVVLSDRMKEKLESFLIILSHFFHSVTNYRLYDNIFHHLESMFCTDYIDKLLFLPFTQSFFSWSGSNVI